MDWKSPANSPFPEWPTDSWTDPEAERTLFRRRLRRSRVGFSTLGGILLLLSLSTIGHLIAQLSGQRLRLGIVLGIPQWDLLEESAVVWGSLLGVAVLWGGWPDESWRRRSGLLLLMCLVDAVLWGLDHSNDLGLSDGKFGHDWFRYSLGAALGWSEFALIASLSADMCAHLGEPQAIDFAKAVRSLASTGAMVWFTSFYFLTNWAPPIWPLRVQPNQGAFMLSLGWRVLSAILMVQVTTLCLMAGRCCGRKLREMAAEDRANDQLPSRSEAGWEEYQRPPARSSGPKGGA